jgi:transposase
MRFYTEPHQRYCGIDLHARSMYVCILDSKGTILLHRDLQSAPAPFLRAIAPYRKDLVVGAECSLSWYWLADLCGKENIPFVLGHALYMRAVHGAKAKNDRIDSHKIAALLCGHLFPLAYVYPAEMRATRDLLRRRLHFVRHRGQLLAHIQVIHHQYNRVAPGRKIGWAANRKGLDPGFAAPSVASTVTADLALVERYDDVIADVELRALRAARGHDNDNFERLKSIPGVGRVLALTILYEVHDISRFPTVQQFASYSRLIKCQRSSGGKVLGTGGSKIGNAHLKWAFSEAAVLFLAKCPEGKRLQARLEKTHGKGKTLSILAHRLGRAAYFMLKNRVAFDKEKFLRTA